MGRPYFTYTRPAAPPPSTRLHLVSCMQLGVARHARRPQNRLSNEAERGSALPKWIMGGMDETDRRRTSESRGKHVITPTERRRISVPTPCFEMDPSHDRTEQPEFPVTDDDGSRDNTPIFWGRDGGSAHDGLSFYSSAEMLLRGAIKTYAPSTPLAEAFQNDSTVYFALLE